MTATINTARCRHGMRTHECATCNPSRRVQQLRAALPEPSSHRDNGAPATNGDGLSWQLAAKDLIMLAAASIAAPFTREELVVTAWTSNPKRFGLVGYSEEYPDANKVFACLCGDRGLVKRGLLVRDGKGRYSMSKVGLKRVAELTEAVR